MFKMLKKSEKYNTYWCQPPDTKKKTEAEAVLKKYYIACNENKRRTKFKEMEREKNELIQNTSYCNHRI